MRYTATYESPLGRILLASDGAALTGLWFVGQRYEGAGLHPDAAARPELSVFADAAKWLDAYFAGGRPGRTPVLALRGTPYQRAVWDELQRIGYGETITYGEVARRLSDRLGRPTASRAAGAAVGRNPVSLIVPCHRVVGANGLLTGYAGGIGRKRALLALERDGVMTAEVAPAARDGRRGPTFICR